MKHNHFLKITLNFLAVILLLSLIATPLYFAKNFAQVAGVKSSASYLVVSQIEKFPNLSFSQSADIYSITFTKQGSFQAFLGILILNNPTDSTQTYGLAQTFGQGKLFFGENLEDQLATISVPSQTSVPISLYSSEETTPAASPDSTSGGQTTSSQSVEFRIHTQ